jgi:hypothetical protein
VLGGAAVLAAGAGTWLLFASASDHDDAAGLRKQANHEGMSCYGRNNATCMDADDLTKSGDLKRTAAVGCFAGAGSIAATMLFVHFLSPRSEGAARTQIVASPTRGGGVVAGAVRF